MVMSDTTWSKENTPDNAINFERASDWGQANTSIVLFTWWGHFCNCESRVLQLNDFECWSLYNLSFHSWLHEFMQLACCSRCSSNSWWPDWCRQSWAMKSRSFGGRRQYVKAWLQPWSSLCFTCWFALVVMVVIFKVNLSQVPQACWAGGPWLFLAAWIWNWSSFWKALGVKSCGSGGWWPWLTQSTDCCAGPNGYT